MLFGSLCYQFYPNWQYGCLVCTNHVHLALAFVASAHLTCRLFTRACTAQLGEHILVRSFFGEARIFQPERFFAASVRFLFHSPNCFHFFARSISFRHSVRRPYKNRTFNCTLGLENSLYARVFSPGTPGLPLKMSFAGRVFCETFNLLFSRHFSCRSRASQCGTRVAA